MKSGRKLIAVFSLVLLLVSSSSFSIGLHWCGGELKDVAIFESAHTCPGEQQVPPCHAVSVNSCCDNATVLHEGNDSGDILSVAVGQQVSSAPVLFELFVVELPSAYRKSPVRISDGPPMQSPVFLTTRRILI